MSATFGKLKSDVRAIIFPSGESSNLIAAHDKAFVDALIDLQIFVECLQTDNTSLFPQCSTLYNCGITVFDAPRGRIKKVSVIDSQRSPAPSGDILFSGTFNPQITDAARGMSDIGTIVNPDLYIIEIIGQGTRCSGKKVPQYFNVNILYKSPSGVQTATNRVTLNDCNTDQTIQANIVANSDVYVSIVPVNVPVKNSPGDGGAQITVNVRQNIATDILTSVDEYCSEIEYKQVDPAYVQKYWNETRHRRYCPSIPFFFGLDAEQSGMRNYPPVPTDATVPAGLAVLPMGFHYPQSDTDKKHRARSGVWAIERGKIYIAPWIDSTETVLVKWDGIKRIWADADPVDDDPLLTEAVTAFVRQNHYTYWDRDYEAAQVAQGAYNEARAKLIHECREETRIRGDEPSFARAVSSANSAGGGALFYNNAQTATASCSSGQTGNPVSVTIPAGTVASSLSQADADTQALAQAQQQATAQLNCQSPLITYYNAAQSFTAVCTGETGAPSPTGTPVTVTISAGAISSVVSQDDANALALAQATSEATDQLVCIWHNKAVSFTASCPLNPSITAVGTTPSGTSSCDSTLSQAEADNNALIAATNSANTALNCGGGVLYFNTLQSATKLAFCKGPGVYAGCNMQVMLLVPAGSFNSRVSQADANQQAINWANGRILSAWLSACMKYPPTGISVCPPITIQYPNTSV
jgi:hypothetical protein